MSLQDIPSGSTLDVSLLRTSGTEEKGTQFTDGPEDTSINDFTKKPLSLLPMDGANNESLPISLSTISFPSSPETASNDLQSTPGRILSIEDSASGSSVTQTVSPHPPLLGLPLSSVAHAIAAGTATEDPVVSFYRGKHILLTGATGFIGKAVLWKLMSAVGLELGKVYLLMRHGASKRNKAGRSTERLKTDILNNKAFTKLRSKLGSATFDTIVKKHLVPVNADIVSPDLSLSEKDREAIIKDTQVIIHCAASLDCSDRLDLAIETNTLGTLRLMDLADECVQMEAFVHMSLAYRDTEVSDIRIQERVYPMELGDPNELLDIIVRLDFPELAKMTQQILAYYPNIYTFTKVLTEHLILRRVDNNRVEEAQGGKTQWPIGIIRATQVGAGLREPLPGWLDGVTGMNGTVFLLCQGVHAVQQETGQIPADIVPVDYLARIVIGCPAFLRPPGTKFMLAYNEIIRELDDPDQTASLASQTVIPTFPLIYQVSGNELDASLWCNVYDAVQHYCSRSTHVTLPAASDYFVSKSLFKTRVFAKSPFTQSLASVMAALNNGSNVPGQSSNRPTPTPTMRLIELASRLVQVNQPFLRRQWTFDHSNTEELAWCLKKDSQFSLSGFEQLDWFSYMVQYSYCVHVLLANGELEKRSIVLPEGWDCALYSKHKDIRQAVVEKQIESLVFSVSDIRKRTDRMVTQIVELLEHPEGPELRDKKKGEAWLNDFDSSLDDWCNDASKVTKDIKKRAILGRWATAVNEEVVKVIVLNDKRVTESVRQMIESSSITAQMAIEEAAKVLQRMRERTQLPYIGFAGSLLDSLLKRLFVSIRIPEDSIAKLRHDIAGKNVVYVPTSKTILDQLLLWYVCLRYQLPLPALVCDETLALLGPLSDIFRIAGAYFVRRDRSARTPLITSVTAAYTETLLHDHGALSLHIEKARSRTGRIQTAYNDGIMEMILEAALEKHQHAPESTTTTPTSPRPTRTNTLPTVSRRETVFVPFSMTFEKIPEMGILIDNTLDQAQPRSVEDATPTSTPSVSSLFLRPSVSMSGRSAHKENKRIERGKYGRAYVGIGKALPVLEIVEETGLTLEHREALVNTVTTTILKEHYKATGVGPTAVVAATVLFGRLSGAITMGDLYEYAIWLRDLVKAKGILLDWQDHEDVESVVAYALQLMDARKNIILDNNKRSSDMTNVKVIEHADNVMVLSYMSNQLVDVLLAEAIFSIVYLSVGSETVTRTELSDGFQFLTHLFKDEFTYPWDPQEAFTELVTRFEEMSFLTAHTETTFTKNATPDNHPLDHTHICLLASLLYPTLDAYWITCCSLSALRDLPYLPRKVVPQLAQWIAAHLISGRRTIYREVLSTDASQNALQHYLGAELIEMAQVKTQLSSEAQQLLLELNVTADEDLVMAAKKEDQSQHGVEAIATLCSVIEKFRYGVNAQQREPSKHTTQVFDKCRNQIKGILRADKSFAAQRGVQLDRGHDQMVQLVYALKTFASSNANNIPSEGTPSENPRRTSKGYSIFKS